MGEGIMVSYFFKILEKTGEGEGEDWSPGGETLAQQ